MKRQTLSQLSTMVGWTGGALVFTDNALWMNIAGWIIFLVGYLILQFKYCDDAVVSTSEVKHE